ncbi:Membrane occupation and recognition nexus protein MORN1 [Balamuthia mandrillaris]
MDGPSEEGTTVTAFASFDGETNEKGKKHGRGKLTWDDGESFEGEFEHDEKVRGTFRWKTGDVYTGEWKNDLMTGVGTYEYADGRRYVGSWEKGYRHGIGRFIWPNGDQYKGEFRVDRCQGIGVHTYADGKEYRGHWVDNKKHGYGILSLPNGERTEGFWEGNLLHGVTAFTQPSGKKFEEQWNEGVREGARRPLKRSDSEMNALLGLAKRPKWAPDTAAETCYKCEEAFTFSRRRHHCRFCGLIFCEKCSSKRGMVPVEPTKKPERVCEECFTLINSNAVHQAVAKIDQLLGITV